MRSYYIKCCWLLWESLIQVMLASRLNGFAGPVYDSPESGTAAVLSITKQMLPCSYILLSDTSSTNKNRSLAEVLSSSNYQGLTILETSGGEEASNSTRMDNLIQSARKIRVSYSCVAIVVISNRLSFLLDFGRSSLTNRLLNGHSTLIVAGNLQPQDIEILASHWTYSMLKTVVLIPITEEYERWDLHYILPYSVIGKQISTVGSWSYSRGLDLNGSHSLFTEKFSNFHESAMNITALPYKPYWIEEEGSNGGNDGSLTKTYSGADRFMLEAMAKALNFTISVLPVDSWDEVIQRVAERKSFMATVVHMVLPQRLERVDFTRTYEHGINIAFAMAKPVLKPQWQSLYYPLNGLVWVCVLITLLMIPVCFMGLMRMTPDEVQSIEKLSSGTGTVALEIFGTLVGQAMSRKQSPITSLRILTSSWLIFAFIIGTAYRSNLIASLVAPRYPPRPESLDQLVKVAKSQSHIDGTRYLEQQIAEHFTEVTGDSRLYVGREGVLPGLNAWPIPHDAPYKKSFDAVILAIIEAGLYNKWMDDMLDQARKEGRQKRREQLVMLTQETTEQTKSSSSSNDGEAKALTIVHLQGPLMLLAMGSGLGLVSFFGEIATKLLRSSKV